MTDSEFPVTAVVLCGGGGRRFAGKDKPLEILAGRPLVAHVLSRLEGQVSSVQISANRNLNEYRQFGYPVFEDQVSDCGPLAGAASAVTNGVKGWLFICPGDAPFLPTDLVERLRNGLLEGGESADVVVPHDGERMQHLFMLLESSTAAGIRDYLEQGGRSVAGWLAGLSVLAVSVPEPGAFTNVNTREELARAELLF